jgi:23S rRNA pseudouridine1911/1915/1917 synthase
MEFMLHVLWEDEHLIAVVKPAGLATVPGRGITESVLDHLKHEGEPFRLIHRLDRDTSGVLLLAKNAPAQRELCRQFFQRTVKKEYLALVAGSPADDHGVIDAPLGPHPANKKLMAPQSSGRPALTRWIVETRLGDLTLLRCHPETGRTHQIRAHLRSIGLPLVIDPLYNRPRDGQPPGIFLSTFKRGYRMKGHPERPLIARLTLHASRLEFHNLAGQIITVTCPLPRDMAAIIKQLSRHARKNAPSPGRTPEEGADS